MLPIETNHSGGNDKTALMLFNRIHATIAMVMISCGKAAYTPFFTQKIFKEVLKASKNYVSLDAHNMSANKHFLLTVIAEYPLLWRRVRQLGIFGIKSYKSKVIIPRDTCK